VSKLMTVYGEQIKVYESLLLADEAIANEESYDSNDVEYYQETSGLVRWRDVRQGVTRGNPWSVESLEGRRKMRGRIAGFEISETTRNNLNRCEEITVLVSNATGELVQTELGCPIYKIFRCDHRLCKACARRRGSRARKKGEGILRLFETRKPIFATFTHKAVRGRSLGETFGEVEKAWGKLTRCSAWSSKTKMGKVLRDVNGERVTLNGSKEKEWSIRGAVVTFEISYNQEEDWWHVHIHALLDAEFIPQREMLYLWRKSLGGEVYVNEDGELKGSLNGGVHLRGVYGSKIILEVTKYLTKGITRGFEDHSDERLKELVQFTRGKRVLRFIGAFYGIKQDEECPGDEMMKGEKEVEDGEIVLGMTKRGGITGEHNGHYSILEPHRAEGYRMLARSWEAGQYLMARGPDNYQKEKIRRMYQESFNVSETRV